MAEEPKDDMADSKGSLPRQTNGYITSMARLNRWCDVARCFLRAMTVRIYCISSRGSGVAAAAAAAC